MQLLVGVEIYSGMALRSRNKQVYEPQRPSPSVLGDLSHRVFTPRASCERLNNLWNSSAAARQS